MYTYLAGPITGLTYKEATLWRNFAEAHLGNTLNPMRNVDNVWGDKLIGSTDDDNPKTFYVRDLHDVKKADIILANFTTVSKSGASSGTVFEVGYSKGRGHTIITAGPISNVPLFVKLASDIHFENYEEAVKYIAEFQG